MRYKLLYVDDEEANLRTFFAVFRRNYIIHTAQSGEEAIELLKNNQFDLVITDQNMPGMSGIEFLRKAFDESDKCQTSSIMISGFTKKKEVDKAKKEKLLQRFISKPWNKDELKEIIDETIKQETIK